MAALVEVRRKIVILMIFGLLLATNYGLRGNHYFDFSSNSVFIFLG